MKDQPKQPSYGDPKGQGRHPQPGEQRPSDSQVTTERERNVDTRDRTSKREEEE